MKEITFIRTRIEGWQEAERVVEDTFFHGPDELAHAYLEVTADLAFAQTHYPDSRVTQYLNNLASALHNEIYRNKREKWSRLVTFWTHEVPLTLYQTRWLLLCSLVIFMGSVLVGVISQMADPEFCRIILGDSYVDMTLDNIRQGQPMAVYASGGQVEMFLQITLNNIDVSFRAFVSGILTSIATGSVLFYNGVMMGCFDAFCYQHGYWWDAFLATNLHGTIEMSSIVVAGAAGLSMGNGWLFPGSYSRLESFRRGARRGLKMVVGTIPLFVVAGFIEGFFTRYTDAPDALRLSLILLSLLFVVYYFVILPKKRYNHGLSKT